MFGIQASQIDMTEDGRLQFDPCFFQPYPETVLEKYPLDPLNMDEGTESLNLLSDWHYFGGAHQVISRYRRGHQNCNCKIQLRHGDICRCSARSWPSNPATHSLAYNCGEQERTT